MKLAIIGYGKMGKAIEEIALEHGHSVLLKISSGNTADLTPENLQACDAAIEFTGPNTAAKNIYICVDAGIPVICGSTGWLKQLDEVEQYCLSRNGAFLYSSNFSIGVNIFFEMNKKLATLMAVHDEYDVSIEEIHHTEKKDAPSGTAITMAENILSEISRKTSWTNASSQKKEELTITSKRIDSTPGTHKVKYSSGIDDIEIIHTAHNRTGFAKGAIAAAEFLDGKRGIFTMKDVLGI